MLTLNYSSDSFVGLPLELAMKAWTGVPGDEAKKAFLHTSLGLTAVQDLPSAWHDMWFCSAIRLASIESIQRSDGDPQHVISSWPFGESLPAEPHLTLSNPSSWWHQPSSAHIPQNVPGWVEAAASEVLDLNIPHIPEPAVTSLTCTQSGGPCNLGQFSCLS